VRALDRGGLTPPPELTQAVLARVRIPVRVMIREQEPFVVSDGAVAAATCEAAGRAASLGAPGLVLGFLDSQGAIDELLLRRVLDAAPGPAITFHRAFEEVADAGTAAPALARAPRVDRVLVSGGEGPTEARWRHLEDLAHRLAPGIRVLAAVGSDRDLLARVAASPLLGEVHVGRAAREPARVDAPVSVARVRELARLVHGRD
jgi:copper homeostasis protein